MLRRAADGQPMLAIRTLGLPGSVIETPEKVVKHAVEARTPPTVQSGFSSPPRSPARGVAGEVAGRVSQRQVALQLCKGARVNVGILTAILSAVAAVIGRVSVISRPDRLRRRIESTLKVLNQMSEEPELTEARAQLHELIGEQAGHLRTLERKAMERRYDPSQPVIGTLMAVVFGYGAFQLWEIGHWYGRVGGVVLGAMAPMILYVGIKGFFTPPAEPKKPKDDDS